MNNGDIVLVNYKGMTDLVSFAQSRYVDFNGNTGESFKLLVASIKKNNKKVYIYYSDFITGKVNEDVSMNGRTYSVDSFMDEYKEEVVSVGRFLRENKMDYSWLTVLQLSALYRKNKNHQENNESLGLFYKREFLEHNSTD